MAEVHGFSSRGDFERAANAVRRVESMVRMRPPGGGSDARGGLVCVLVKTTEAIAADASGSFAFYWHETKGSEADTGQTGTGYTRTAIDDDKWCLAVGLANGWELIPLEC